MNVLTVPPRICIADLNGTLGANARFTVLRSNQNIIRSVQKWHSALYECIRVWEETLTDAYREWFSLTAALGSTLL